MKKIFMTQGRKLLLLFVLSSGTPSNVQGLLVAVHTQITADRVGDQMERMPGFEAKLAECKVRVLPSVLYHSNPGNS